MVLADLAHREYKDIMSKENEFDSKVEELRASLLEYDEDVVLEALARNNIVNRDNGLMTDYWLNLIDPDIVKNRHSSSEEQAVLDALAKVLKRRIK